MASTSTESPPNWLELPYELTLSILQRLPADEILGSAQKVCLSWRRICRDPTMWKTISFPRRFNAHSLILSSFIKQAVRRSSGELIDISLECFCYDSDDLLHYIAERSHKLQSLTLANCMYLGLGHASRKLPHLENLHLYHVSIPVRDIIRIGNNCPNLKSFKLNKEFGHSYFKTDDDAIAISNYMPGLRSLQLFGNKMTDNGLQAILHGCPHLESLDVRMCFNIDLDGNLEALCKERIRDFKLPNDSTENCGFNLRVDGDNFVNPYSSCFAF